MRRGGNLLKGCNGTDGRLVPERVFEKRKSLENRESTLVVTTKERARQGEAEGEASAVSGAASALVRGTVQVTTVPSPSVLLMSSAPPMMRAR